MDRPLREIIAAELASWETPFVELAIFRSDDPDVVAAAIEAFCLRELGVAVAGCRFYSASIGCVAGLALADGRRIVLKAHQPDRSPGRLRACQAVQALVAERGYPAPRPLLAPTPLAAGYATVESMLDGGEAVDAHEPAVRATLAQALHELTTLASAGEVAGLGPPWFSGLGDRLWPTPHSRLFDFEASAAGAEWIDGLARAARAVPLAGSIVVGHFDFRAEHVRAHAGRLCAVYDWDSLHLAHEPLVVGTAAHAFTADFSRSEIPPAPSPDEITAFIDDYQSARRRRFTAAEMRLCRASCLYSLAYTARCEHSIDPRPEVSEMRPFVRTLRTTKTALLGRAGELDDPTH